MVAHVHQFMCLSDNYGVLLHDPERRRTATIDAPEAAPILAALDQTGWTLTDILVTHHHADHTQGIGALKEAFPDARIVGPASEADKIGHLDQAVAQDDHVLRRRSRRAGHRGNPDIPPGTSPITSSRTGFSLPAIRCSRSVAAGRSRPRRACSTAR